MNQVLKSLQDIPQMVLPSCDVCGRDANAGVIQLIRFDETNLICRACNGDALAHDYPDDDAYNERT